MNKSNDFLKCKDCAFYYINKRRYTKKELVKKLVLKEYEESLAQEVADYLEELKYIDDADYARRYILDAVNLKKHGIIRIKMDLYAKGVDRFVIEDVIADLSLDTNSVLEDLIDSKAKNIDLNDEKALNRIKGFLLRRGFGYGEINKALGEYRSKKENT